MQQSLGNIYDLTHITHVEIRGENVVETSPNWEITEIKYLPITATNGDEIQKIQVVIKRKEDARRNE